MGLTHGDPWRRGPKDEAHDGDGGNKETLSDGSSSEECETFERWHADHRKVRSTILASMSNDVQKQYDRLDDVASILQRMKEVYAIPDRHTWYVATKEFFRAKMTEGSSMQEHGVKMLSLVEKLEDLKARLENDMYIDATIKKSAPSVLIGEASTSKAKGKRVGRWKRKKGKAKVKTVVVAKEAKSAPVAPVGMGKGKKRMGTQQQSRANDICAHYHEKGHWKRNYPNLSSDQGMFVVEVNMVTNFASWVLDTGCGAHICNDLQVLQKSRKLSKDEVVLRLGDGKAVAAEAVGIINLVARGGFSYFITFTDDHSWYGYVYLIRYKFEAFVTFKEFRLESGFIFKLNSGVVAWKSSKQDTTADSTMEAEYIATSEAVKEAVWMKNYIQELGVVPSIVEPVVIFYDNNEAIAQTKESRSHHRSKHILRRYHLLREMVGRVDARMDRVNSAENTADPLTKPVSLMHNILGRWA
ncbi:UNVERIFIED_CONTAM: Retrovirus-related Pol polyprotein from transposon TNT 1-94 [Sesamum calycinum]|uniref:Retrovirus-related Pol polyprotein from transposon TNT 1-94 n=1 Tax=Sesamum calycinum TaxID=2727403 RepID=A0AAW2K620_9LAMI